MVALLAGIETPALRREQQLQEILLTFNLEEIAQLFFDLNVEYEDLPGQTKTAKSRDLVQLMGRHGRLDELEGKLKNRS